MEKGILDLSNKTNAEASRNQTALIGMTIMNTVLAIAYFVEVLKGVRTVGEYILLAVLCLAPFMISWGWYRKKKEAHGIRYVLGIGFLMFYTYLMFHTASDLAFCYVLVAYIILIVYVDIKYSVILGVYAFLVNVAVLVKRLVTTGLSPEQVSNMEIMLACVALTCIFAVLAIKKVTQIGQANIDRADHEKEQADKLLQTTLEVASSIMEGIEEASSETNSLSQAIDATQRSMEDMTNGANDAVQAIMEQQQSTNEIDGYIKGVSTSTEQIVTELGNAEGNLEEGQKVMNDLLSQVKVSESSGNVVAKEMEGLKENARRMQNIVELISSVAHQTSLLALNASIEAARAGEAGRGFAVVASEISGLAAQTNGATGDINKLIESITGSVTEVTEAVDSLLESNHFQNEYVGQTAENFRKIHESNREISRQAEQLKQAVTAVETANKRVVESIDNVSAVTEEVTASANETLNSCNLNLESIEKVAKIMDILEIDAKKLHREEA